MRACAQATRCRGDSRWAATIVLKGTVDSVAAGVHQRQQQRGQQRHGDRRTLTSNGCVWPSAYPVRIRLDEEPGNLWPAGTTATVVITGKKDRDASQMTFFQKLALRLREFG
ncbi:p-hydroxybenzoic acid efflux subunit AaeA [Kluyvera cryocrescens]|uniref:p-hydroxybenzoic acid efflux subunit AaeA n=1 Tax=Kluyvera cryocrescens TaxID=580 RepID=A0A485AD61_KLUCR|nr:p-hydroxybenzoic acid efflux subunit AaeA [Kluyvera cryocrescens]